AIFVPSSEDPLRKVQFEGKLTAKILIGFDHGRQSIMDICQRFVHSVPLGDQLRQERRGHREPAFGLRREKQRDLIEHRQLLEAGASPPLYRPTLKWAQV